MSELCDLFPGRGMVVRSMTGTPDRLSVCSNDTPLEWLQARLDRINEVLQSNQKPPAN